MKSSHQYCGNVLHVRGHAAGKLGLDVHVALCLWTPRRLEFRTCTKHLCTLDDVVDVELDVCTPSIYTATAAYCWEVLAR